MENRRKGRGIFAAVLLSVIITCLAVACAAWYYYSRVYVPSNQVTVTFLCAGEKAGECTVLRGSEISIPEGPELPGYSFQGWEDSEGELLHGEVITADSNCVIKARYYLDIQPAVSHEAYMLPDANGFYHPADSLTRADIVYAGYILMGSPENGKENYSDVPRSAGYRTAAAYFHSLGVFAGDKLYPERTVTRKELADILSTLFPYASDPVLDASGLKNADEEISRYEATSLLNRVFCRCPDCGYISSLFAAVPDANHDDEYYFDFAEAALEHKTSGSSPERWTENAAVTTLSPGINRINGNMYYVRENGTIAIDETVGTLYFDRNGKYTSGSAELDAVVQSIIAEVCTEDMDELERLKAVYSYVVKNCEYRKGRLYEIGETGWECEEALDMLSTLHGNCYGFAASFCELARALGFDATAFSGLVVNTGEGYPLTEHGWVEVEYNGQTYVCDPEIEYVSYKNLFMMEPDSPECTRWRYTKEMA